eukprot:365023-Chlamydomonas_euryale.AAC.24
MYRHHKAARGACYPAPRTAMHRPPSVCCQVWTVAHGRHAWTIMHAGTAMHRRPCVCRQALASRALRRARPRRCMALRKGAVCAAVCVSLPLDLLSP